MPDSPVFVLYLSYDGLTDPLGQSQILPYLKGLSEKGYRFTIISAEKKAAFASRQSLIQELVQESQIDWQPIFYTKKPPVLSTLWDLRQLYRKAAKLHAEKKFTVVHCRSYLTALVGLRLKREFGLKFIFDMRGFWADERVEGGLWSLQNPVFNRIYRYFKQQEQSFLQHADYTISLTQEAKTIIRSRPGLQTIPIQVIPCCVDTTLFRISEVGFRSKESVRNPTSEIQLPQFTLSYLGSLGTWYLPDEMLRFFNRLLLRQPDSTFLFITPDNPQIIREKAAQLGIPAEKITITRAERREVPQLLAQSQFSVFFIKPSFSKKASSPTKMGEVLAVGLPVICNTGVGDTDYIVQKYQAGIVVSDFTEKAFDQAIAEMASVSELPSAHFRRVALDYFDLQKGVDLYAEVYQHLSA